ncbi:DNA alkylation repair protein [Anoxybacteroides rupiense]|uniref:DNA alkylation repair protein n=1 Tax=Anoxybacteroides rupiense TaxID=311460 RepID=UPI001F08F4AD|nr:DNA alkylation repair protein [Anoxybacillus rupiensis]
MTHPYAHRLAQWLRAHRHEANAGPMKQYMRNQFEFLGIKTPERRALLKEFLAQHGLPPRTELADIVSKLWEWPERELQYCALALLEKEKRSLSKMDLEFIEKLITNKPWWDTVDMLAANIVGPLFKNEPECIPVYTERWMQSNHMWLQRTAILFQLRYKEETDEALLYQLIRQCRQSSEFFIQKAIGWALREYSKTHPASVQRFVESETLTPLSKREALKVIQRRR